MKNEQQIANGNGLPPLGLQATTSRREGGKGNKKGRKHIGLLIVGGIVLVGMVLAGGYYSLARKPKVAQVSGSFYYCLGTSDESCQGKNSGSSCMGGNGTCRILKVVRKYNGGPTPGDAICECRSKTCNKGVSHGCGAPPDNIPSYNKTANIGPFPKDGKLVLLFYPLDVKGGSSGVLKAIVSYEGKDYPIEIGKPGKQRIVTDIQVKAGTTATLTKVIEHKQQDACAPKQPTPQQGIGWIPVNNDLTCGSGLPGPPQGGACTPFKKLSVKEAISWAESFGQPILSKECWADWMEWPGDYDFNDYFLMFAVEPTGPELTCSSLTKNKETIVVGDKVKFVCQGQSENQIKPDYQFRYRILKRVDGKLDDSGYQIVGKDSYVGSNTILLEMKEPGDYTVECRLCDTKGNCTAKWKPTKILK